MRIPRVRTAASFSTALCALGLVACGAPQAEQQPEQQLDGAPDPELRVALAPTAPGEMPPAILGNGGALEGSAVAYLPGDAATRGYLSVPEGDGPFPSLVIIHEWNGLVDRVRQVADDFAAEGYVTLAVDLYGGQTGASSDENIALMNAATGDMTAVIANLDAAVSFLRARSDVSGRVGAMGWCFGGGIALSFGLDGTNHEATAIFYGRLVDDPAVLATMDHEVYGTFARLDGGPAPADVEAFEAALGAAGIENDLHIYDDVGHGFWLRIEGDPEQRNGPGLDAWQRLKDYLDCTLRGRTRPELPKHRSDVGRDRLAITGLWPPPCSFRGRADVAAGGSMVVRGKRSKTMRKSKPEFSVIMPTYNSVEFIREAVESVLNQEFSDLELIVVDDGSTDGTADVLAEIRDDRMTVQRVPNGDVGAARNVGLELARGRVFTFLDSDDRWRPHKLTVEREILRSEPEVGLTFSNFERFTSEGTWETDQFAFYPLLPDLPTRPTNRGRGRVLMAPAFLSVIPFYDFPAFCQAIAVRREVIGDIRFPDRTWDAKGRLSLLEDLGFVPRLFRRTTVAYIPEPLADVRRHDDNSTKHFEQLGYAILDTLMFLRDESLSTAERRALESRIARQEISVGHQRVLDGEPVEALRAYWRGALAGRPHSAVKGVLSLPFAGRR